MKRLLISCVFLVACTDRSGGSPNGSTHHATDLAGSIACGESTCGSGDLCVTIPSPVVPEGDYDDTQCWTVPATCDVYDCNENDDADSCAKCVIDEWYPCAWVELEGRRLHCVTN